MSEDDTEYVLRGSDGEVIDRTDDPSDVGYNDDTSPENDDDDNDSGSSGGSSSSGSTAERTAQVRDPDTGEVVDADSEQAQDIDTSSDFNDTGSDSSSSSSTSSSNTETNNENEVPDSFESNDEPKIVKEKVNEEGEVVSRETADTRREARQITPNELEPAEEEFPTIDANAPENIRERQRNRQRQFVEIDKAEKRRKDLEFREQTLRNQLEGREEVPEAAQNTLQELENRQRELREYEQRASQNLEQINQGLNQARQQNNTTSQGNLPELRETTRENPDIAFYAKNLREARNTPTNEQQQEEDPLGLAARLKDGRSDEIQDIREEIENREGITFEEVSEFANETRRADLSTGELNALIGRQTGERISRETEEFLQPKNNSGIGFIAEGFAGLTSGLGEGFQAITTEEEFDLEEARTVTPEEKERFEEFVGGTVSEFPAIPAELQKRIGQGQQLASGEMTKGEAAAATTATVKQGVEFAEENPGLAGAGVGTGFLLSGPVSTSGFRRASGSTIEAGKTQAGSAASTAKNQLTPGGFDETTFRDLLAGDVGERAMTPDEIAESFSEGDVLMGRNVPNTRGSRPTTERTRTEFLRDFGLPRNTEPSNFAGQVFEPETNNIDRFRNILGGSRKGQAQLVNPVQKIRDTVNDFDTTGKDLSISDRVDRVRDRTRTPERNNRRTGFDRDRDTRRNNFDRPRGPDSDSDSDLGLGLGTGLGLGQGTDEGLENPPVNDQFQDQENELQQFQQRDLESTFTNRFDSRENRFESFESEFFERDLTRPRDSDSRFRRRDLDFGSGSSENDFIMEDTGSQDEAGADLGNEFRTSLTAGLFNIEADEDFDPEEFVGSGVGIRPLVDDEL